MIVFMLKAYFFKLLLLIIVVVVLIYLLSLLSEWKYNPNNLTVVRAAAQSDIALMVSFLQNINELQDHRCSAETRGDLTGEVCL